MDIEKRAAELGIDDVRFTKRSHVLTGKWRLEDMNDDDILEVNDWLDFVEEHEKVAETTPSDVHQAADAKGVEWDDSKPFMDMSQRVTGERHLDDMSEKQLEDVVAEIEKGAGLLDWLGLSKGPKSAVIIKGNPAYIEGNPSADKFYEDLAEQLRSRGFEDVSFDPGAPMTSPKKADLWVGHSRGADRLQYAPRGTGTIDLGPLEHPTSRSRHDETEAIARSMGIPYSDLPVSERAPVAEHYLVTPEMLEAFDKHAGQHIEKNAAHAKGRLKQRAPHVPHAVLERIEAMAATLKLDPLRTYHAPLRGGGYAVLAPVGKPGRVKHVVKTVFSHGSKPPGIRLPGLPKGALTKKAFIDELEKSAGFKDTLERLKKKVSAFDVGAALATAGLLGLTAADIRRGGFKGRGPYAEATAEFFERLVPAYEKMPGRIERMGLPKSRVRDIVRRITPDDIPKIEVITSKGDLSRRLGMTPEAAEKTWVDFEKGNAAALLTSKGPSYLIASPRTPQSVIEHEVGHIVDKFRGGPNKALVDRAVSLQSESMKDRVRARASHLAEKLYGPHHQKMVMSPERAAWEFARETAEKADLMPAALKTYETGFHAHRAPVALAASAGPVGLWAGVRGGEALLDKRRERIEKSAAASSTILGEILRRSGRAGAARKYDFGTGVLGERLRKVLMKEYGPSWSRIMPRKASKRVASMVALHPELAPMLAVPGLPPGGPLVYALPKLGLRKALGIKERGSLERFLHRLVEKKKDLPVIPSRGALAAGLLGTAGAGGLGMGAIASHNIPQLTYQGEAPE